MTEEEFDVLDWAQELLERVPYFVFSDNDPINNLFLSDCNFVASELSEIVWQQREHSKTNRLED